jgi:hypothetical protein
MKTIDNSSYFLSLTHFVRLFTINFYHWKFAQSVKFDYLLTRKLKVWWNDGNKSYKNIIRE